MNKSAKTSILIPVYRSAESLPELYRRLVSLFEQRGDEFEIIFVEDCGGDRSWDIIKEPSSG